MGRQKHGAMAAAQHAVIVFWTNGPAPTSFRLFSVISNKSMWKISSPSSTLHQDLNPRPLEHELSPITTRPGLPLCFNLLCPRSLRWMEEQSGGNLTHQLGIPWFKSYTVNNGKRYSFALLVFIEASQPFFWWQWRQIVVVNFCLFFPHHRLRRRPKFLFSPTYLPIVIATLGLCK